MKKRKQSPAKGLSPFPEKSVQLLLKCATTGSHADSETKADTVFTQVPEENQHL